MKCRTDAVAPIGTGTVPWIFSFVISSPAPELNRRAAQTRQNSSPVEFGRLRANLTLSEDLRERPGAGSLGGEAALDAGEEELAPLFELMLIGEPGGDIVVGEPHRPGTNCVLNWMTVAATLSGSSWVLAKLWPAISTWSKLTAEPAGQRPGQRGMGEMLVHACSTRAIRAPSELCQDTVLQSMSQISTRGPGRTARYSSASAALVSGMYSMTCTDRARSTLALSMITVWVPTVTDSVVLRT